MRKSTLEKSVKDSCTKTAFSFDGKTKQIDSVDGFVVRTCLS